MSKHLYLNLVLVLNGKGAGRGLAPTRGSIVKQCDYMVYGAALTNRARGKLYSPWPIIKCVNTFARGL
jgi:hypothetical protein